MTRCIRERGRIMMESSRWWDATSGFFFLMLRRPPRSTQSSSSAASDVYKRQSLSSTGHGLLSDAQGFCIASEGFDATASEFLAAVSADIASMHQRHARYPVSYTHLRAHETPEHLVCRLPLDKKKYTPTFTLSHPRISSPRNTHHRTSFPARSATTMSDFISSFSY